MTAARMLLLGSESWINDDMIAAGLSDASAKIPLDRRVVLVRNSYAPGAAKMAADVWAKWVQKYPGLFEGAVLIPPGGDITDNIDIAVLFFDGPLSTLAEHEVGLVKAAGVEIMDYSVSETTEAAA